MYSGSIDLANKASIWKNNRTLLCICYCCTCQYQPQSSPIAIYKTLLLLGHLRDKLTKPVLDLVVLFHQKLTHFIDNRYDLALYVSIMFCDRYQQID